MEQFLNTLHRFPISSAFAVMGTSIALILIHFEFEPTADYSYLYNLEITSVLGFLLFLSLRLFIEKHELSSHKRHGVELLGVAFLVGYFFLLPSVWNEATGSDILRVALLGIAFLFSITFSAFLHKGEINGFWHFNKHLFIRLFFAKLYGLVLFLGILLAYASINQLFDITIPEKLYPETFVFIWGICVSTFFLAGIPENLKTLEKETEYPKGIQFFVKYIIVPLILLYSIIVALYVGKIALTQTWPEGMVSWLILLFSIAGMIAHILLFPLKNSEQWLVRWFSKIFFTLEIPFLIVLFMAFSLRIQEYGLTEARYYGVALGVWLFAMSVYFLFSKAQNIKLVPITLFLAVLFSSFGPWGAIAVAQQSQMHRLESQLQSMGILVDGKIMNATEVKAKTFERKELAKVSASLEYITSRHGTDGLQPWFSENIKNFVKAEEKKQKEIDFKGEGCWNKECHVMRMMGLDYVSAWEVQNPTKEQYLSFSSTSSPVVSVAGFSLFFQTYISANDTMKAELRTPEDMPYTVRFDKNDTVLELKKEEEILMRFPLASLLETLEKRYEIGKNQNIPTEEMTLLSEDKNIRIEIENIELKKKDGKTEFQSMGLKVFLK